MARHIYGEQCKAATTPALDSIPVSNSTQDNSCNETDLTKPKNCGNIQGIRHCLLPPGWQNDTNVTVKKLSL